MTRRRMSGGCSHQYHNRLNGRERARARESASEREHSTMQISCMITESQSAHLKPLAT